MHDRKVTRIVTPGTLIDENFMDPYVNNYVMAIHLPENETLDALAAVADAPSAAEASPLGHGASAQVGLAWLDLSTGVFFTQLASISSLSSVLSRVCPREIVLDKTLEARQDHAISAVLAEERYLLTYSPQGELHTLADWKPLLESDIPPHSVDTFSADEVRAGALLLHYVKDRLQGMSMKLQPPQRHESMQVMNIDRNSMRSLEVKTTIRDNVFRGSLLHAIRRTVTKSGARLLNEWLSKAQLSLWRQGVIPSQRATQSLTRLHRCPFNVPRRDQPQARPRVSLHPRGGPSRHHHHPSQEDP